MARSELSRLRNNLRSKIRYYNQKGYDIDASFVSDLTLEELQEIDTETLLNDIYYEQQAEQYESEQEEESEEDDWDFPEDYDAILDNFRNSYRKYDYEKTNEAQNAIDRWLEALIESKGKGDEVFGKKVVAQMIYDAQADGVEIKPEDVYGKNLENKLHQFMEYLPEDFQMGQQELDALMEYVEYGAGWSDYE